MSGWRIGYLVVPPPLYKGCVEFQQATFSGVSEFVQEAALAVLAGRTTILPPLLEVLRQHRTIMLQYLAARQIPCFPPEAAYFVFPDLSRFLTPALPTARALSRYLQEHQALEILPGDNFGAPGFARLSFAIPTEKLTRALGRLDAAFQSLTPVPKEQNHPV
jgi:aspartate aminotransferase